MGVEARKEGGKRGEKKRGAFELNIGWERSLEGWDAGTNRPVFSLYTLLLYEGVLVDGFQHEGQR